MGSKNVQWPRTKLLIYFKTKNLQIIPIMHSRFFYSFFYSLILFKNCHSRTFTLVWQQWVMKTTDTDCTLQTVAKLHTAAASRDDAVD